MTPGIYAAFLRGINVGGNRKVPMAVLRDLLEGLGFHQVQTVLQSGNAVFAADAGAATGRETLVAAVAVERAIEEAIAERLQLEVPVIVRTAEDLSRTAAHPFLTGARVEEPAKTIIYFLKTRPECKRAAALLAEHQGPEEQCLEGSELFVFYPQGLGKSRYDNSVIDRALGTVSTGRNLNTLLKMLALAEG